jgi:hypothetical protein
MPINYYPNRVYKKNAPSIDRTVVKLSRENDVFSKDVTTEAIDKIISANTTWSVESVELAFDTAVSRTYTASVLNGRKIVENLNDSLWFQITGSLPHRR